jgi:hypothetical protein
MAVEARCEATDLGKFGTVTGRASILMLARVRGAVEQPAAQIERVTREGLPALQLAFTGRWI